MTTDTSKKPKFLEASLGVVSGDITFKFADGRRMVFDIEACSDKMRHRAMQHGFMQKLRDTTAGFSKDKDIDGAMEAVAAVWSSIRNDEEWNRTGGGTGGMAIADLSAALAAIRGVDVALARAAVEKATPEQRAAWVKNAKVAAKIAEIRLSRLEHLAGVASDDGLPTFIDPDGEENDVQEDDSDE